MTETCQCDEAGFYARKKGGKERAHNRIEFLFGEKNQFEVTSEKAVELLHTVVELIGDSEIQSATVEIGNGVKGKINLTSKEKIKVNRTKTEKSTYEE